METAKLIWTDGRLVPWEDATVHVLTHGLHYGTGVFEGIRAYETEQGTAVFRLVEHLERLHRSAKAYAIPLQWSVTQLSDGIKELLRENQLESAYIRPLVIFELGGIGLNPASCGVRTFMAAWRWGAYLGEKGIRDGIRVRVSSWRRIDPSSFVPIAKGTGQYLNSVLAKQEAVATGYDEAIMLNQVGTISEGSGENLFLVRDGAVFTPPVSAGILDGITRASVMSLLAADGFEVKEATLTRGDLYGADELFFTGTAAEVTPIREVDDRPVGQGKPGPVTRRAQDLFAAAVTGRDPTRHDWLTYV
ncbi:MAG TPA: branched-chain amino acid transaminase [Acidimicrobiia bacterium]|jgi:branched-chain amino acid aminotransferase